MEKIILYLHANDYTHISWAVINEAGVMQQSILHGEFADFCQQAQHKSLTVIVPAQDILLTQVSMPKLNRNRLLQALPYALEEQLLADIDEIHFAIGPYQADGKVPVAIVTKQKMADWLSPLNAQGLSPAAFIPGSLVIPVTEGQWEIQIHDAIASARIDTYQGFACDKQNLAALIDLTLAEQAKQPSTIQILNFTQQLLSIQTSVKINETLLPENQFFEKIAQQIDKPAINLLQGIFQAKSQPSHNKQIWLYSAYIAAAWIGLLFISHLISFFILHHQASVSENAIAAIYKRHFPQSSAMVAPKERMQQKLDELTTQGNKNHLLLWLGYLGKSMAEVHGINIQQLDYRDNQLLLQFTAPKFDIVDAFSQSLSRQGLTVKQQDVAAAGAQVKGNLLISGGGRS